MRTVVRSSYHRDRDYNVNGPRLKLVRDSFFLLGDNIRQKTEHTPARDCGRQWFPHSWVSHREVKPGLVKEISL